MTPEELAIEAANAADDKKARDIRILDMREKIAITDYFLICSGNTDRQVHRIQDSIEERLRNLAVKPARREGVRSGHWVLLDYGDLVVHVFREEERAFYDLEHLWQDVPVMEWRTGGA